MPPTFPLAGVTSGTSTTTTQKPPVSLTDRELEVLKWVAEGKSSWEIAHIILCKECTVNFHFRNIKKKLNVSTRGQALFKALKLKLIAC